MRGKGGWPHTFVNRRPRREEEEEEEKEEEERAWLARLDKKKVEKEEKMEMARKKTETKVAFHKTE